MEKTRKVNALITVADTVELRFITCPESLLEEVYNSENAQFWTADKKMFIYDLTNKVFIDAKSKS